MFYLDIPDMGMFRLHTDVPGHYHKRPTCVLDEEDGPGEIENATGHEEVCSVGPYTKKSKVDVRYI